MKPKWTRQWPRKPGRYWFFGWPYGNVYENISHKPVAPELNHVRVERCSNGLIVVRDGHFWFEREGGIGLFCPADVPELPDVEAMRPPAPEP